MERRGFSITTCESRARLLTIVRPRAWAVVTLPVCKGPTPVDGSNGGQLQYIPLTLVVRGKGNCRLPTRHCGRIKAISIDPNAIWIHRGALVFLRCIIPAPCLTAELLAATAAACRVMARRQPEIFNPM